MRILLDEFVDARLAREIVGFSIQTVSGMGWTGVTNGELLSRAASQFDALVTEDRNLPFQQQLPKYAIAVVLIESSSNRLADLVTLVPKLIEVLPKAQRGVVLRVGLKPIVGADREG